MENQIWPEYEISDSSRRTRGVWKRRGTRVTLLWLRVLWRCHAERSWGGRRRCGISGGRGCRSGEGAGKLRGNEDILLTLPSTLRDDIGHGDKISLCRILCDKYKRPDTEPSPCYAGCIAGYLIIQQAACGEVLSTSRQLNADRETDY